MIINRYNNFNSEKRDFIPLKIITAEQLNLDNNSYKI